jgi:mannose-6-phosphate isomerase-like protein (cupin superfamily)
MSGGAFFMRNRSVGSTVVLLAVAALASAVARSQNVRILDDAPLDEVVAFSSEQLAGLFRTAAREGISTTRMLEGGEFNVNIRHVENATPANYRTLVHPDTIDVWVVQQGYGTLVTGGERTADGHSGGDERFIGVGDVIFIPAGVPHGIKESVSITWLNIRFPEHRN